MSHTYYEIDRAFATADERRQKWLADLRAKRAIEQTWPTSVARCFNEVVAPAMEKVHLEATRVGYYAPFTQDTEDGRNVIKLTLFPQDENVRGGGGRGVLTVIADKPSLSLYFRIVVEGEERPEHPEFTCSLPELTPAIVERELVRLMNAVMVWG